MKLAGVARFDCDRSTQEFTCYMAGLASPGDHTCGWTTSAPHSHRAWRYWFRWGCGGPSTTSFIADLAGGLIPDPSSTGPDHAALHPLRHGAPVTSRNTRYVATHPIRRGVMPTDRVHRLIDNKLARGFSPWRRRRRSPTGPGRAALHHLGSITPPPSWCNTQLSGVIPLSNN